MCSDQHVKYCVLCGAHLTSSLLLDYQVKQYTYRHISISRLISPVYQLYFKQTTPTILYYIHRDYLLLDATYDEERVREGHMIIAMNKHREICALHMNGTHLLHKDQVCLC